ncbi:MAG: glycoside hydrolase family 25 protein [Eubacteriales bacterium]|nr:glycoside hydrolase family 25 protein [Eubacteriales bacterium]
MNLLKLPEKDKEDFDFEDDDLYPEEEAVIGDLRARSRKPRPEIIMGIAAVIAAVIFGVVLVMSFPYMFRDEDPETAKVQHIRQTEPKEEVILEPTIFETEPENPTIPPDPNPYNRYDFQYNRHNYLLLQNVDSSPGIDVSAHQGDIDWAAVKNSGIEFAIIRLGYRGYGSGKLVEDDYARKNLKEAKEAGLKIGAYFFSQALDIKEVDEEIQFILNMLADATLDMPIVLDWEIPAEDARTKNMDARTLTDIQLHFCGQMKKMGFQPMIYFNWHQSENLYYLSELEDYPFWLALYQDRMTYPWKVEMWQWTSSGKVPGINGNVDINVYMPY